MDSARKNPGVRVPARAHRAERRLRRQFLRPGLHRSRAGVTTALCASIPDRADRPWRSVRPYPRGMGHPHHCGGAGRIADRPELDLRVPQPGDLRPGERTHQPPDLAVGNDPARGFGRIRRVPEQIPGIPCFPGRRGGMWLVLWRRDDPLGWNAAREPTAGFDSRPGNARHRRPAASGTEQPLVDFTGLHELWVRGLTERIRARLGFPHGPTPAPLMGPPYAHHRRGAPAFTPASAPRGGTKPPIWFGP